MYPRLSFCYQQLLRLGSYNEIKIGPYSQLQLITIVHHNFYRLVNFHALALSL
jgi:hypothetical protein